MTKAIFTLGLLGSLVVGCGSPALEPAQRGGTRLKTVEIPQTAVTNQEGAGYCWAYSTVGFLESKFKAEHNGQVLNLSEEALGFYRAVSELAYYSRAYTEDAQTPFAELEKAVKGSDYQGWLVKVNSNEDFPFDDGFALAEKYGAIPETAWSVKFSTPQKAQSMAAKVQTEFLALMRTLNRSRPATEAELIEVVGKGFGSVPPTRFRTETGEISAVDFARNTLGFKAGDYVNVEAETSRDVERVVKAVKKSLSKGVSVPIGFGVSFSLLKRGTFQYENKTHEFFDGIDQERSRKFFARDGGHAVLVTDFVNEGGKEGAVSPELLAGEMAKPVDSLSYLKVKNSWGTAATNNEGGIAIEGAEDGYYRLNLGYLKGEADSGFLSVVVSRDIAAGL